MKRTLQPLFIFLFTVACSSVPKENIAIVAKSSGIIKEKDLSFPIYLSDKIENRSDVVARTSENVFIVHPGHLLKAHNSKEENEAILESLTGKGIDVVNLTIEDFAIAEQQEISFEKYSQQFINSSVIDLNEDAVIIKSNITPYAIHEGVALIGLSDKNTDKVLNMEKFLVSDYVSAILRTRKAALKDEKLKDTPVRPLHSFVIVHTLGGEIDEIMGRLPPNFISSLAD